MFFPLSSPPPPVNRYFSDENDGLLAGNYSAASSSNVAVGHPLATAAPRQPPHRVGGDQFGSRPLRASVPIGFGNQSSFSSSSSSTTAVFVNEVIIGMDSSRLHLSCCRRCR